MQIDGNCIQTFALPELTRLIWILDIVECPTTWGEWVSWSDCDGNVHDDAMTTCHGEMWGGPAALGHRTRTRQCDGHEGITETDTEEGCQCCYCKTNQMLIYFLQCIFLIS